MEILIKVGDGPSPTSYKDGDIVQAFSMDQIYFCHAQHVCHITNFDLDSTSGKDPCCNLTCEAVE